MKLKLQNPFRPTLGSRVGRFCNLHPVATVAISAMVPATVATACAGIQMIVREGGAAVVAAIIACRVKYIPRDGGIDVTPKHAA